MWAGSQKRRDRAYGERHSSKLALQLSDLQGLNLHQMDAFYMAPEQARSLTKRLWGGPDEAMAALNGENTGCELIL